MRYLSWDVGIKNMAYALLEKNDDVCKLLRAGIINLVDKRDVCSFKLRTGKDCGKIAKFKLLNSTNEEKCYCKAHSTKVKIEPIQSDSFKCVKCNQPSKINILNKMEWSWCEKHENLSKKVLTQFKAKKITGQNCAQQPMQELISELTRKLDENKDFIDVEGVWIENQPALINPTIKTVASALYTYFVIRGNVDKKENKIKFVKFASPLNKLKVSKSTTKEALDKAKSDREYYNIEKGLGKIYVRALITKDELNMLETIKEKNDGKDDDVCDAYLQGFHHIFEGNIPEHYQDKLKKIPESELEVKKIKSKKKKNINTDNDCEKETEESKPDKKIKKKNIKVISEKNSENI
jgi:hypothetical protein